MKEIIKTVVIVILALVAIYYAFVVDKVHNRMDVLNEQDSLQTDANDKFDNELHDLELQFIGRGKHIQEFQKSLMEMDAKLDRNRAILQTRIDSVGFLLADFQLNTETALDRLRENLDESDQKFNNFQRQTNRTLTDIQQALTRLNREFGELDKKVKEIEELTKPKK